jgi:hypothetical protein
VIFRITGIDINHCCHSIILSYRKPDEKAAAVNCGFSGKTEENRFPSLYKIWLEGFINTDKACPRA